jgi:hypothetical protein
MVTNPDKSKEKGCQEEEMKLFGVIVLMLAAWIVCVNRLPHLTRERAAIVFITLTLATVGLIYYLLTLP